jgi:hypothetical protein
VTEVPGWGAAAAKQRVAAQWLVSASSVHGGSVVTLVDQRLDAETDSTTPNSRGHGLVAPNTNVSRSIPS